MVYVYCDPAQGYGDDCWSGSPVYITVKFPGNDSRREPVKMYLRMSTPGAIGAVSDPGGMGIGMLSVTSDEWTYAGFAGEWTRVCMGAVPGYRVRFESDHFILEDREFNVYDPDLDTKNICPSPRLSPDGFTLIPKTNACGESGWEMTHCLVRFTGVEGSTVKVDGVTVGTIGANGLDVPVSGDPYVVTTHDLSVEKYGYTYTGTPNIKIYPKGYGVPGVLDAVAWEYPVTLTKNPPNACGQYDDDPNLPKQTDAKMVFRCVPSGGTLTSSAFGSKTVTSGEFPICMPAGFTWVVSYSKNGYQSKDINVSITEEMCNTMTTYPVDINLGDPLPVASFIIVTSGVVHAGDVVTLNDTSTGTIDSWIWEIYPSSNPTDITTYYSQNIEWVAPAMGNYVIHLTVYNGTGHTMASHSVYVNRPAVVADFTAAPTYGCYPLTVQFTSLQTGTANHSWSFGDGTTSGDSLPNNPTHVYTQAGIYDVTLTCVGAESSDSETKPGYITVLDPPTLPVASFEPSTDSGAAPLTVTFNNTHPDPQSCGITHYLWKYNDGSGWKIFDESTSPTHTFTNPGVYDISLMVTNDAGQDTQIQMGCIEVTDGSSPTPGNNWLLLLSGIGIMGIMMVSGGDAPKSSDKKE